jgi:nicotinate-nucleotide pyrophosphorylase (carboxylating)
LYKYVESKTCTDFILAFCYLLGETVLERDFHQIVWDDQLVDEVRKLIALAISEDFGALGDITTQALVPENAWGKAVMHSRQAGVASGLAAVPVVAALIDTRLQWEPMMRDGDTIGDGRTPMGPITGPVTSIFATERKILNLVARLCGIATLTKSYINEVAGTNARIYDTRKTTLGWRRLEKYAVRCGGGTTHRTGLFDAILIKDNHLAFGASHDAGTGERYTPAEAVRKAREWVSRYMEWQKSEPNLMPPLVEIEVDSLEQLIDVLPESPDIVMLDNMTPEQICEAVEMRNILCRHEAGTGYITELEASGGVNLKTIRAIAETGVERISVGALTHAAISLDIGLDY